VLNYEVVVNNLDTDYINDAVYMVSDAIPNFHFLQAFHLT